MNAEEMAGIDLIEESNSLNELETNIDLLLTDVSEVQKILNSNNVSQCVDVNEIYEKLEELTYIAREERIVYVATQLLYKFGIIADKNEDNAFKYCITHGETENNENLSSSDEMLFSDFNDPLNAEMFVPPVQNEIVHFVNTNGHQNGSHFYDDGTDQLDDMPNTIINYKAVPKDNSSIVNEEVSGIGETVNKMSLDFKIGDISTNYLQDEACALIHEGTIMPSTGNDTNKGLNNFVLVATADNCDQSHSNNSDKIHSFDCKDLMEEAEFISGMFPHFELEQITEFLEVNKDIENRMEVVSDEILKLQENMLLENAEMSELIENKKIDKYPEIENEQNISNISNCENEEIPEFKRITENRIQVVSDEALKLETNILLKSSEKLESKDNVYYDTCIENENEKKNSRFSDLKVYEFPYVNRDVNQIEIASNEKFRLQENSKMSELADIKQKVKCDNSKTERQQIESKVPVIEQDMDLMDKQISVINVANIDNNTAVGKQRDFNVISNVETVFEESTPQLPLESSVHGENSSSEQFSEMGNLSSSNSRVNHKSQSVCRSVPSKLVTSASVPNANLPSKLVTSASVPNANSLSDVQELLPTLEPILNPVPDKENIDVIPSTQMNCLLHSESVGSEVVNSLHDIAQQNILDIKEQSLLDIGNTLLEEALTSQQNGPSVSCDLIDLSLESVPYTVENSLDETNQLNILDIEKTFSDETDQLTLLSSEFVPSVSRCESLEREEADFTPELNNIVCEKEKEISTISVSSVIHEEFEVLSTSEINSEVPKNESQLETKMQFGLPSGFEENAQLKITELSLNSNRTDDERSVSEDVYFETPIGFNVTSTHSEITPSYSQTNGIVSNMEKQMPVNASDTDVAGSLYEVIEPNDITLSASELHTVKLFHGVQPNSADIEAASTSQLVNQGCRKKQITYDEFISQLPHLDVALLKEVWSQIGNNYSAVKEFIAEQLEDISDDNHYDLLLSLFPQADPKFLQEKSLIIGTDKDALEDFIEEQLQNNDSKARYYNLLAMFPKVDSAFLQERCNQVSNSDEDMRNLITELLKMNESDDAYHTLLAMFPESDPAFLHEKVDQIGDNVEAMKKFVTDYLEELDSVKFNTLIAVLPDADPEYLQNMFDRLGNNEESMKLFIMEALDSRDYPTRDAYLKRQEIATLKRKYKEELNIQEYLEVVPDPWTHFKNKKTTSEVERRHGLSYLESRYKEIALEQIDSYYKKNEYNLTLTCQQLNNWQGVLQQTRQSFRYTIADTENIPVPFLQEVAFIENETKMKEFLRRKEEERKAAFELAKANGELLECQCCFDNELLDTDVATCMDGHIFCKQCIKRSAEIDIGDGSCYFSCLTSCKAEFSLKIMQLVLNPTTFSKMLQQRQLEEVQAAGIAGLENCPFCGFATIPESRSKVFTCLNPECMRDSCRTCKRPSHIPLGCKEVESKETKMRTVIEDRMTEALVRTCWKCNKKFIKESGCNKMRCKCGALMCYLCRKPVADYTHFNGQGGTEFHKCALYSDIQIIHDVAVQEEGIKAKKEVQADNPGIELKHDPTKL
ncbi:hypothetical protein L9F63_003384 [Diploptera punctata]|uniref:RING-type domain-containing protein n=1 Tax=Diploptera punctata TaxID=6984 RepID=A0AAD7ZKW0_DIPPU|nr:hypothetical protein L9F63_003384 [Diploptera punctata]